MRLSNFINGINILRPYYDDSDGFHIGAEHDQFYAYATDRALSPEDQKAMCELGWFQPESGFSEDSDGIDYAPEDGWSAFI